MGKGWLFCLRIVWGISCWYFVGLGLLSHAFFLTQSNAEGSAEERRGFCGMLMGGLAVLGREIFSRKML